MYYEEKIIDGVMCWRDDMDKPFTPYTIEELSKRYERIKQQNKDLISEWLIKSEEISDGD